jgi:hypothetical protein
VTSFVDFVDDRRFAMGLCELFREQMAPFEETHLLPLAERACSSLKLQPADVPIEGYYSATPRLEHLFRLVRSLQRTDKSRAPILSGPVAELRRVYGSSAFGREDNSSLGLLPRMASAFSESLAVVDRWTVERIAAVARTLVRHTDADLLAVACLTGDPVAICTARETLALTARLVFAEAGSPVVSWRVTAAVAAAGQRFIDALANCTGLVLPPAEPASAAAYTQAARSADLDGRCIWVGDQTDLPFRFYHWYVRRPTDGNVADFWASAVWTTMDVRRLSPELRPASGAQVGPPPQPAPSSTSSSDGWLSRFGRRLFGR